VGNQPVSDADLRTHFIREAKNLISLRKNNTIGYREKWLHSLLIEKMQDDSLPGLDLEFLYYEMPVGKVRRNKQFGREHIDILAKERHSKVLVVVEVKNRARIWILLYLRGFLMWSGSSNTGIRNLRMQDWV
jgi:hypothetical protein